MPGQSPRPISPLEAVSSIRKKKKHCRSRAGCLPCRRRRRKCDGNRPTCRECHARCDKCVWGLKVSFHPSRSLELSSEDTAALVALDKQRKDAQAGGTESGEPPPPTLVIIDDTEEIVRSFTNEGTHSSSVDESDDADDYPTQDHEREVPNLVVQGTQPYTEFLESGAGEAHHEQSVNDSLNGDIAVPCDQDDPLHHFDLMPPAVVLSSPEVVRTPMIHDLFLSGLSVAPFSLGQAISRGASPEPEPRFPVSQRMKADLVSAYIRETATWCETTDSDMHFSARSVHQMMESTPFVAAAMSLASRQLDTLKGSPRQITLELYQYTIRLLLGHDPVEADSSILATCTLLCVYEMMASTVAEWRRHLRGCAGLLRMRKWNGNSEGIVKSCFWAFARIDVWAAFILDQTTLIPTDSWVQEDSLAIVAARGDTDDYCNFAILIFAKIVNLLNGEHEPEGFSLVRLRENAQELWEELQQWRRWRLQNVKPLLSVDASERSPYPTIVFALSASICGNTFYHTGSILLLQSGLVNPGSSIGAEVHNPVWHARELGGISTSNTSHANWVNHLQPLYIAGRVFGGITKPTSSNLPPPWNSRDCINSELGQARRSDHRVVGASIFGASNSSAGSPAEDWNSPSEPEDFAAEKIALLKHLAKIERETGWKTSDRAKDLRRLWGLEN